ncbi:hypothetical protein HN873_072006, partial [Arachis hypogaea]
EYVGFVLATLTILMNVYNSKRITPWRLPMLTTTVHIKGTINKAVTIIKVVTTTKEEETMVETK